MINSVRNSVLSILNKNNYGYLSPADFNLFAKNAQIDIFNEYFSAYNDAVNRENARVSGTGYANTKKMAEEVIDLFSETKALGKTSAGQSAINNSFYLPSLLTTGDIHKAINKVVIYPTVKLSGTSSSVVSNQLVSTSQFTGVSTGDIVVNSTTEDFAYVTGVQLNSLNLSSDIFTAIGQSFRVYSKSVIREAERVSHSKIHMLQMGLNTSPSSLFPAYVEQGNLIQVYPDSNTQYGSVFAQYIRIPRDPKWTFTTLVNGEPSFNQSSPDYRDFELPNEDEVNLVLRILQYAGMSIREIAVQQYALQEEMMAKQKQ
jgi:hypothetical protein